MRSCWMFFSLILLTTACMAQEEATLLPDEDAPGTRLFQPVIGDHWIGDAICYGPHRDGQRPGGAGPSADQIREDLLLMLPHWNLLRIYGSGEPAETMLSVIRADGLDMKVMLGVWIAREEHRDAEGRISESYPENVLANRHEVESAIRLALKYPEIVLAVSVGNETQIDWSAHRSPLDILIGHVRKVRENVKVPVTVADDFNYWNKTESRELAAELDFITMHAHPMWNGLQLEEALSWLKQRYAEICAMHPELPVILGETGWATSVHDQGEQARLIQGHPGETEQKIFHRAALEWASSKGIPLFFFEAFDENWKGGDHPAEVEKHWGLFRADRSAKAAMKEE